VVSLHGWCVRCRSRSATGEAFQVCAHAVPPMPVGLLDIAAEVACFGVPLGRLRGRGRPGT
jgi:hypothetical protein